MEEATLPVWCTERWFTSLQHTIGRAGSQQIIHLSTAALNGFEHAPLIKENLATHPLLPYERPLGCTEPLRPVAYPYLQATGQAFHQLFGTKGPTLALHVGAYWWRGATPISVSPREYLHFGPLFGPVIYKVLAKAEEIYRDCSFVQRLRLAVHTFSRLLSAHARIPTRVEHDRQHLILSFPTCPFCANTLPYCNMLLGVTTEFLAWLWGSHESGDNKYFQLSHPDSHIITLQFK